MIFNGMMGQPHGTFINMGSQTPVVGGGEHTGVEARIGTRTLLGDENQEVGAGASVRGKDKSVKMQGQEEVEAPGEEGDQRGEGEKKKVAAPVVLCPRAAWC